MVSVNQLMCSLLVAWFGAGWATRMKSETLYRVIAILLVVIAVVLVFGHQPGGDGHAAFSGSTQIITGIAAGFVIGVVASFLGVAGGELLIPRSSCSLASTSSSPGVFRWQ